MAHLGEEAEDSDGEEARVERGHGGGPGEVPELLRRVPGEAGGVQRWRREAEEQAGGRRNVDCFMKPENSRDPTIKQQ